MDHYPWVWQLDENSPPVNYSKEFVLYDPTEIEGGKAFADDLTYGGYGFDLDIEDMKHKIRHFSILSPAKGDIITIAAPISRPGPATVLAVWKGAKEGFTEKAKESDMYHAEGELYVRSRDDTSTDDDGRFFVTGPPEERIHPLNREHVRVIYQHKTCTGIYGGPVRGSAIMKAYKKRELGVMRPAQCDFAGVGRLIDAKRSSRKIQPLDPLGAPGMTFRIENDLPDWARENDRVDYHVPVGSFKAMIEAFY